MGIVLRICDEDVGGVSPHGVTPILGFSLKGVVEIDTNTFTEIVGGVDSILFSFMEGKETFGEIVESVVRKVLGQVPCDTVFKILEQRYNLRR